MSEPRVLACPSCGAPAAFRAPFCTHCRGPLTWGAVPTLARGRLVTRLDPVNEDVDKRELVACERTRDGALATVGAGKAANGIVGLRRRHGCVVLESVALDPHAAIGVAARQQEEAASGGYSASAIPHFRSVGLSKVVASVKQAYFQPLHDWQFNEHVRRVGEPNEVEVRAADSILQVLVNGHLVATCIDATFGFGGFGWRVQSLTAQQPARVLIRSVAVYDVA